MSTYSLNKNLLSLRETIESNLHEKIKDDRDITELADEILGEAWSHKLYKTVHI